MNQAEYVMMKQFSFTSVTYTVYITISKSCLFHHIPNDLLSLTSGVEKKNDDFRRYFHRRINKWDTCKSLLMIEKREEELEPWKRTARQYTKRDTRFWHEGGKQESARKFPRLTESTEDHNQQTSTQTPPVQYNERELKSMKVPQLCNILEVELGLSVDRGKRKQELIEMICQFHARSQ